MMTDIMDKLEALDAIDELAAQTRITLESRPVQPGEPSQVNQTRTSVPLAIAALRHMVEHAPAMPPRTGWVALFDTVAFGVEEFVDLVPEDPAVFEEIWDRTRD